MKLYDFKMAPSPRRVRIFIAEKGLDIPTVEINLAAGEQLSPEYRRINPNCVVPALELDDGTVICESLAICTYLEDLHPEPALIGRNPKEKAEVLMWFERIQSDGYGAVGEMVRNSSERFKDRAIPGPVSFPQIAQLAERGRKRLDMFYSVLEERLSVSPYVAGDTFSLADIAGYIALQFAEIAKAGPPEGATAVRAWYDKVSARPSAAA